MQYAHGSFAKSAEAPLAFTPPQLTPLGKLTDEQMRMVKSGKDGLQAVLEQITERHYPNHSNSSAIISTR